MKTQVEVEREITQLEEIRSMAGGLSTSSEAYLNDTIAALKWVLS